jgi:hypothetical protein
MKHLAQFLPFLIMLCGCSASNSGSGDLNLEVVTQQADSWVNLMPGSTHSFFISSTINIRNEEDAPIDSLALLKCEIRQEGKTIYVLHPVLKKTSEVHNPLNPDSEGIYTINLPVGTPVLKDLDLEKTVSIYFYLSAFNKVKVHEIDDIKVVKAY